MGMAASQARLLTLTARIHDVEYQAQNLQNAKLQLSTQQTAAYKEYMEALDSTTLTIMQMDASGKSSPVPANFNNLFSHNRIRPNNSFEYALVAQAPSQYRGLLVVEDAVAQAFENYTDAFAFAINMIDPSASNAAGEGEEFMETLQAIEESAYQNNIELFTDTASSNKNSVENLRKALLETYCKNSENVYKPDEESVKDPEDKAKYNSLLKQYRDALYKRIGKEICTETLDNNENNPAHTNSALVRENAFDADKLEYYISIFNQIKAYGGCVSISKYNGTFGDAASNGEYLKAMIESGKFTIDIVTRDAEGNIKSDGTSPSSDSYLSYTTTTDIDSRALKKAEAKYEKELSEINKQDKQYDLSLSKLETERNALTTEYDSVKKVIQDNVERTFGIFS